jgi:hypothetical protein
MKKFSFEKHRNFHFAKRILFRYAIYLIVFVALVLYINGFFDKQVPKVREEGIELEDLWDDAWDESTDTHIHDTIPI